MTIQELWFGSEASVIPYERYLRHLSQVSNAELKAHMTHDEDVDRDFPALVQIEGSVGIVSIEGSLVPQSNWLTRLFGLTGYDEIAEGVIALREEGVSDIVLSINSGGGSVMGLEAAGNVIAKVAAAIPVYTNTEGAMHSAGYYLGAIAREVSGTRMANIGSIGTIITHVSVHRALKESGRDVTIIRSGKEKALGHPAEPLSKHAKEVLQAEAHKYTAFFRDHVETYRGASLEAWTDWGEGKTFFTEEAISVGLADRVSNLSQLVNRLNDKAKLEENTDMKKKIILHDDKAVAQLESGVPLQEVAHQQVEETEVSATADNTPPVESVTESTDVTAAAETTEVGKATDKVTTSEAPVLVAHLKEDIKELRSELSAAQAQNINLKADLDSIKASQEALKGIVAQSANKMQIGLGQTATSTLAQLSAEALIEQHAAIQSQFNETFKIGQQSKAAPVSEADKAEVLPMTLGIFRKSN